MSGNFFEDLKTGDKERVDALFQGQHARIERIISHGHCSPEGFWYDQGEAEWVMVVSGEAILDLKEPEERITLKAGDWLWIAAKRPHRVHWTTPDEPTLWLGVFTGDSALPTSHKPPESP